MTNHLLLTFPDDGSSNDEIILNLAKSFVRVVEDPESIAAEDHTQTPYLSVLAGNNIYQYDENSLDPHDVAGGVLKSIDDRRYVLQTQAFLSYKVDDKDLVAQPASPTIGDAYILTAAPTGTDWGSKAKHVATYTEGGWKFSSPEAGSIAYVRDEGCYYHYSDGGDWTKGLGDLALANDSVDTQHLKVRFGFKVEAEQADPPGSLLGAGVAYIVAASPTGAWVGHATKVAISDGSVWQFFTPDDGSVVYDRGAGHSKRYLTASGVWARAETPPAVVFWGYDKDGGSANVTGVGPSFDTGVSFDITADPALYEIVFRADETFEGDTGKPTASGLFLDAQADTIDSVSLDGFQVVTPVDDQPHTYHFKGKTDDAGANQVYRVKNVLVEVRLISTL